DSSISRSRQVGQALRLTTRRILRFFRKNHAKRPILPEMKIYTKKGDEGETGLYGGDRVPKDHLRIRAYGTLDELNAAIGLALAPSAGGSAAQPPLSDRLRRIQGEIFQLGSELATPRGK